MFRKSDGGPKSPYPVSSPGRENESYEDFLDRVQKLFEEAEREALWDAIDSAPGRWQRKPEFMLIKSLGFLRDGDVTEAKKILTEIERAHPKYLPIYFYQATMYMQDLFPAHALRALNKIHAGGTLDSEAEAEMQSMEKVAHSLIAEEATRLKVPVDRMEKASWHHESAQEKLESGQWAVAEQMAREALRLIPDWSSPRNNRSYVLYFMGRVKEALEEAHAVLAQYPDDLHALKNLVIFHSGLGEEDKARQYSKQMAAYLDTLPQDADEVDMIILVLGLVKDEERLWALARKYLNQDVDVLMDNSWYALGVASIRGGHLKEARKLLEKIEHDYEPAASLAIELRKALKAGTPVSVKPELPGPVLLLPEIAISELAQILGKHVMDELPRHVQKKLEEYTQKRPFVINGLFRLLTEPQAAEIIPSLLLVLNQPEVDARLRAFALGDAGTKQQRLHVLSAMAQMGKEVPPSPIRFWDEEIGEWREVDFTAQMLTNDFELNISPQAARWAEKAQNSNDTAEKISLWRKAVETDPKSGYAVHMLGILLIQNGQKEEGKKLARRAIEVDPNYMFAYANLALMEAQEENPDTDLATQYLSTVAKAPVITEQTAFLMHFALMLLAFDRKDFESARKEFEIAADLRPEDPLLGDWDVRLRLGEVFSSGLLSNWQEESNQRAHNKAMRTKLASDSGTVVTLNSLSREVLGAVARVWGLTTYGKKAELVNKIIGKMQDQNAVEEVCNELSAKEKDSLQWTLENGGWRSWKEFIDKYGDDSEESPWWNYHEPETVVGRLRQAGFLAKGTLDGEQVVFVPADLRESLRTCLKT
jgi:tetratricopeptide (TPR) repeat protein